MGSTKKAFMDPGSSLMWHVHRAFNSICYEVSLNLENFRFSSQTVK